MGARDLEARAREALGKAVEHARDARLAAGFADDAVRLAEEVDDPRLLATALDARLTTHAGPDDLEARLSSSLRLLALVRHEPDPEVRLAAHVWRLTTALEHLDLGTVRRQLAALDLLADESGEGRARFLACSRRAMFALTEGDAVGAARLAAEAAETGVTDPEDVVGSLQAELARQRGDRTALSRHASALEERSRSTHLPGPGAEAAVLWLESGEPERTGRLVDRLAERLEDLPRDADWLVVVSKLCEAAAGSGRTATARTCARLLEPYAGRAVLKPLAQVFAGVVEDYLALATGDADHADRARAAYRALGADWWAGRGALGRPQGTPGATGRLRVLHLHPAEADGPNRLWCVGREGSLRMVPSMHGLEYLRLLVQSPGVDVPALELSAAADPTVADSGTGTLVDQQALTEHRRRSREEQPAEPADREQAEQARAAVRKAIRAALARLELHDGEVAQALRTTIRTGATCRYEPDQLRPVEWRLARSHPTASPTSAGT